MALLDRPLEEQVLEAIRQVLVAPTAALHEPLFDGNEASYLKECLDSTFVSSVGPFVDQFEAALAKYVGAKYVVAVVNGTSALHLALKLVGVNTADEVLIPALTFVATANAVAYCNATPHFVDSEANTLGMASTKLRDYLASQTFQRGGLCINKGTGNVIRAMVPMHTFGHPVDLEGLLAIERDFNIPIVEDAAESLGSYYQGQHTGTFGRLGTLSFNGNKILTTGGGGAVMTSDAELAKRAKYLSTTAKVPHRWEYRHDEVGYNYRMPNLNAALGCAQLENLPKLLAAKRILFKKYEAAFAAVAGLKVFAEPPRCASNYWLQTLLLEPSLADKRDAILQATNSAGVMTRPAWTLLSELIPFMNCPRMDLKVAQLLATRIINIPSSSSLGQV